MQMKKNRTASSSLWEHRRAGEATLFQMNIQQEASACFNWLPHLPEASKCPFVATNLSDHHPIMLVLVWQTIFVFKNTKDHKNVKNLDSVHKKFYNRKQQKKPRNKKRNETIKIQNIIKMKNSQKKRRQSNTFLLYWHFWFTPLISMLCVN